MHSKFQEECGRHGCEYSVVNFPSDTASDILSHSPTRGTSDTHVVQQCELEYRTRRPIIHFGSQGRPIHVPTINIQVFNLGDAKFPESCLARGMGGQMLTTSLDSVQNADILPKTTNGIESSVPPTEFYSRWMTDRASVLEPAHSTNRSCLGIVNYFAKEIHVKERKISARGEAEFSGADFGSLFYLVFIVREALRFHPAVFHVFKTECDDIIPFSKPITTSGKVFHEIPRPKGQKKKPSVVAYNQPLIQIDSLMADIRKGAFMGVYPRLTFSAGIYRWSSSYPFMQYNRSWIQEPQSVLAELLNSFYFSPTPKSQLI
ncbi:uncharacterized protein BT62DRAFT_1001977 [Guyanagaster necrorhizus]|uniref:Uncharacterized protein n=1 Tax=Guyanagaster necrorhizus TaxID=856835 RepID=A0A9P7VY38_9AGAR|nr:uncharacterized protein BT62DRAFT_1001977 [Guyanagaster necrorhizus MCA 3950]KAG7449686.1 hypothetical protein BT62DRAFT_1001977 [Guyanagaster necrorhizus MCA 3950]